VVFGKNTDMVSHPLTLDYLDLNGGEEFVKLEINNPE